MDGKPPVCPAHPNISMSVYDTEEALREYIRIYVKIPFVSRLGVLAQTLDFVADAAPGVREILAVGKVCYDARTDEHDLVVVDAESSGHVASQLAAPRTIRSLAQVGMLREQTDWMIDMLSDPATTSAVLVSSPEESPVDETIELAVAIRDEAHVAVPLVIVNRMPEMPPRAADAAAPRITALLTARHDRATAQVQRLVRHPGCAAIDVVLVPRFDTNEIEAVADALADEFGEAL
jgi:anion-transporting  ArsA/GET3 family ATPase